MSRINCLASSQGGGADLHGDMRERNMGAACHSSKCVTIIFDLFSLPGTQHFNSSGIHKNNGRNLLEKKKKKPGAHALTSAPRSAVTYSAHNKSYPSDSTLFQESHLISYWPMKQCRVRGK